MTLDKRSAHSEKLTFEMLYPHETMKMFTSYLKTTDRLTFGITFISHVSLN